MKKLLFILISFVLLAFISCSKSTGELNGETFVCYDDVLYARYEFKSNGSVYHYQSVKGSSYSFDTEGCALYYELDGSNLIIYHGVKGWKSSVRHTPYARGQYYGNHIKIDGHIYNKR